MLLPLLPDRTIRPRRVDYSPFLGVHRATLHNRVFFLFVWFFLVVFFFFFFFLIFFFCFFFFFTLDRMLACDCAFRFLMAIPVEYDVSWPFPSPQQN